MMVRRSRSVLLACTAAVLIIPVSHAVAQNASQTAETTTQEGATALQKIVVKGKRAPAAGSVAETPLASETTAQQIDDNQITSIEDLGRTLEPGVSFDRTTNSTNIRGLDQDRVLTTVDGIEIPYLLDGARDADGGVNSFDFNSLSTVDIVRGADSSRAGSGALGGAVVLRTLEPEDLIGPDATWGGIFKLGFDSEDESIGSSAAVAKRIDNTAILFQGGYAKGHERDNNGDVGGYSTTRTDPDPRDTDQYNLLFKVRQYTDGGHVFGLTAERFDRDEDIDLRHSQSLTGNLRPDNWDGSEDVRRDRISLDYRFEAVDDDALIDSANAVFYWQDVLRGSGTAGYRYRSVIGDYARDNEFEERDIGFSGNVEKSFETGGFNHRVTAGLNIVFSKATQYSAGVDSCSGGPYSSFDPCNFLHTNQSDMPDVDGKRVGLFIDDKISFGDGPFSVTPGLRFDWYDYSPKETASYTENPNFDGLPPGQSDSQFSPKLRASYQPREDVELYAQWAMAFRAPDVSELYLNYGAPGTYLSVGNPDLKPETGNGFEIGANLGDQDFGGHIGAFYNRYRNFIDIETSTDPTGTYPSGIREYFNRDSVRIYGVELKAHKTLDNGIRFFGALSYANGKDTETAEYIRSVAPFKIIVGTGYAAETWGADIRLVGASGMKDDNDDTTFDAPGYGIVDLTAWWEPEQLNGMTVRAGIYNLFDKTYYDAVAVRDVNLTSSTSQPEEYYSEPGRTFKLTLTQRF